MPVIEASFRQLRTAGVERTLVITSDRKPELMQYLGNGGGLGLDLAFLQQARAEGLAAAATLSLPWTCGANACLLLPDTIVRPEHALKDACALFESQKADLVLGVFPTDKPKELGPVQFDAAKRVIEVQDKPFETDLNNSWAMAVSGGQPSRICLQTRSNAIPARRLAGSSSRRWRSDYNVQARSGLRMVPSTMWAPPED